MRNGGNVDPKENKKTFGDVLLVCEKWIINFRKKIRLLGKSLNS